MVLEISKELSAFILELISWQSNLLLGVASALMQAGWGPKPEIKENTCDTGRDCSIKGNDMVSNYYEKMTDYECNELEEQRSAMPIRCRINEWVWLGN